MDMDHAIDAHVEWKMKFRQAIAKQSTLDAPTIAQDACCELGRWLHGVAKMKYGHMKEYRGCLDARATFHREAGRVAGMINQKNYAAAEAALGGSGFFSDASNGAVIHIRRLKHMMAA